NTQHLGLLRNYCQQARKTAELADLLAAARASTREPDDHPLPRQNALHRSVVKLLIEDYEAGASTYELAERYNVRRNTVRDTLRRAGFDLSRQGEACSSQRGAEDRGEASVRLRFDPSRADEDVRSERVHDQASAADDMNSDQLRCRVLARSLLIIPERRPHELRPVLRAVEPHSYMLAGLSRSRGEYGAADLATRRRVIIQVEHVHPPGHGGYRLLVAAQSAAVHPPPLPDAARGPDAAAPLDHSTIPAASSGLAVAIDWRSRDGARLLGYPPSVGAALARLRITPCRAREIITESTRASSAISSGVVAIENGMKSSSSPTTIAQSNCCPLPTCPLRRCTPALVMSVEESPILMRPRISSGFTASDKRSCTHPRASAILLRMSTSVIDSKPAAARRKATLSGAAA